MCPVGCGMNQGQGQGHTHGPPSTGDLLPISPRKGGKKRERLKGRDRKRSRGHKPVSLVHLSPNNNTLIQPIGAKMETKGKPWPCLLYSYRIAGPCAEKIAGIGPNWKSSEISSAFPCI